MKTYALTAPGRQRDKNEDEVLDTSLETGHLLVVADGMGGHAAGDVASKCATLEVEQRVTQAVDDGRRDYETILADAISRANRELRAIVEANPEYSGMGTTVVAAILTDGKATIANVGDSRAYHVDDGIEQVTVDQSLVQELIDQGEITEAEAANHPQRNVVSQALGSADPIEPDFYSLDIDGTLLLCSDGLTEEVAENTIYEIISNGEKLSSVAQQLVSRANQNGGSDNISVVLATHNQA